MTHLSVFSVLAVFACFVEFGLCRGVDRRALMTPEEKLADGRLQFQLFKIKFNRTYPSPLEELKRFGVFLKALDKIGLLNFLEKGTAKYDVNDMADMTEEEYKKRTNYKPKEGGDKQEYPDVTETPPSFDWRDKNAVTPVKDQGSCGSCWAFCTVSNIESVNAIKNNNQKTFSEQQLVDCDRQSSGCNGGWPESAIKSIINGGGINTDAVYPYQGRQGSCRFQSSAEKTTIKSYKQLKSGDEKGLAGYIATQNPTINAINADKLQYYSGGIIAADNIRCRKNGLNHAVNIVGYGRDQAKQMDYWIVRNSWGSKWGDQGYFKIQRGPNACGIATYVYSVQMA